MSIHKAKLNRANIYVNGGTFDENTVFTSGKLAEPIKTGYSFAGWYANPECTGDALEADTSLVKDQNYYAKWIIDSPVTVATETELRDAVSYASEDAENPTEINVTTNIELTSPLVLSAAKHIKLIGANGSSTNYAGNKIISAANSYDNSNSVNFITVGENSSLVTENITLDAKHKGRIIAVSTLGSFTMKDGTWITNGGNPDVTTKISGGGLYSWSDNATITMDGGKISECVSSGGGNGGAVTIGNATNVFTMNAGVIENNEGSYAGGVLISNGTAYLKGGTISGNKGTDTSHQYGGGVFVSKLATVYLGGSIKIQDNTDAINNAADLWLGIDNTSIIYLQSAFTGSVGLKPGTRTDADIVVQSAKDYIITQNDLTHFFSNIETKSFYLQDNKIKHGSVYEITFNNNYGDPEQTTKQSAIKNIEVNLKQNDFLRFGYAFTGWNTAEYGSGTAYADGDSVALSSDITLYAQWKELIITLADKTGADALTYDGTAKTLTATLENTPDATFTYTYAQRTDAEGEGTYGEATATAPTDAGYYKVVATLSGTDRTATAYLEIKPVDITAETKTANVQQGDTALQQLDLSTLDFTPSLSTIGTVAYSIKSTQ